MLKTEEYRWKASECRRKAEEARHLVDKHAWLDLPLIGASLREPKNLNDNGARYATVPRIERPAICDGQV